MDQGIEATSAVDDTSSIGRALGHQSQRRCLAATEMDKNAIIYDLNGVSEWHRYSW